MKNSRKNQIVGLIESIVSLIVFANYLVVYSSVVPLLYLCSYQSIAFVCECHAVHAERFTSILLVVFSMNNYAVH
jgi:hypothetical protein